MHKIPPPQSEESSSSSSGSSSISSSSSGWTGSGYRQSAADVRRGLTLTDYCADSLPDAPFLRSVWMALDDWKRPVRKLLMPKQPKVTAIILLLVLLLQLLLLLLLPLGGKGDKPGAAAVGWWYCCCW